MLILTYNHIICFLVPFRICFLFPKNLSDNFIFYTLENAFLMLVSTFSFSPISLSCLYRYHPKKYKITFFIPASSRKKVLLKGLGITSPLYNKISIHSWCIKTWETNQGMEQIVQNSSQTIVLEQTCNLSTAVVWKLLTRPMLCHKRCIFYQTDGI